MAREDAPAERTVTVGGEQLVIGVAHDPIDIMHLGYKRFRNSCLDLILGEARGHAQGYLLHPDIAVVYVWRLRADGTRERLARVAVMVTRQGILPLNHPLSSDDIDFGPAFRDYLETWSDEANRPLLNRYVGNRWYRTDQVAFPESGELSLHEIELPGDGAAQVLFLDVTADDPAAEYTTLLPATRTLIVHRSLPAQRAAGRRAAAADARRLDRALWRFRLGHAASWTGFFAWGLAVPLIALEVLNAPILWVSGLTFAVFASDLLGLLPSGAVLEGMSKRRAMIVLELGRVVVLALVVGAAWFDALTLVHLYAAVSGQAIATGMFRTAVGSYVPSLAGRTDRIALVRNRIDTDATIAAAAGPLLAGLLIGQVGTIAVVAVATVLFATNAALLVAFRAAGEDGGDDLGSGPAERGSMFDGLRFVLGHPVLNKLIGAQTTQNFFAAMVLSVSTVYLVATLHASEFTLSVLAAIASFGGVVGAALARVLRNVGSARLLRRTYLWAGPFFFLLAIAQPGFGWGAFVLAAIAMAAEPVVTAVATIIANPYQSKITPRHLYARVESASTWVMRFSLPLGALAGGLLGATVGVRSTLVIAAAGLAATVLWVAFSRLRGAVDLDDVPVRPGDEAPSPGFRAPRAGEPAENAGPTGAGTARPSLVRVVRTAVRKPFALLGGVPSRAPPWMTRLVVVGVGLAVLLVVQLVQADGASGAEPPVRGGPVIAISEDRLAELVRLGALQQAIDRCAQPCVADRTVASVETRSSRGTAFVIRNDGTHAAAITYVQHDGRRSRGDTAHIPAPVLRAYLAAVERP